MGISIEGVVSTKLGLASHQNSVPLLRQLTIANSGVEGLDDLIIELEPSLPFAAAKTWRIDRLGPDSSMAIPDRDIELKEGYLADMTESMQASVHLRLRSSTVVVAEQRFPIKLLARNQWGGAGSMPELLTAIGPCMDISRRVDEG